MAKIYYLPTATAITVASFTPTEYALVTEPLLAVEYVNYGIIGGLQITSLTRSSIIISSVLINDEFSPSLHGPREEDSEAYLRKGFPRRVSEFGSSFIVITEAPAASDHLRALCYGKPIDVVKVCTNHGDFVFKVNESVLSPQGETGKHRQSLDG